MPVIQLQHVVSCSSEDLTHKADNLLKPETYRKWKCSEDADRHSSVILQFEKAAQVHSIDIGNESSAFVEVLVGHSTSTSLEDYQVILVTSSFMSPIESKNGTNGNRVRMFGADKLSKAVQDKKWDRVKIVCSQPFNKFVSYGLSFIKFHSPPENNDEERASADQVSQQTQSASKLGMFRLKAESKSTSITPGSFFSHRSIVKQDPAPLTGAAAVRAAATLAAASFTSSATTSRSSLSSSASTPSRVKPQRAPTPPTTTPRRGDTQKETTQKRRLSDEDEPSSVKRGNSSLAAAARRDSSDKGSRSTAPPTKKTKEETSQKKVQPFNRLMEGVTFVLSGFQNPLRGDLRDKALAMGAKYKTDWGRGCTHLICAFANTPKFNQVKGQGKIVTKAWILDSYRRKSLYPCKRYNMLSTSDDSSSYEEESESDDEEEWEPADVPKRRKPAAQKATPKRTTPKHTPLTVAKPSNASPSNDDLEIPDEPSVSKAVDDNDCSSTDVDSDTESASKSVPINQDEVSSGVDTEDEVRRIQGNNPGSTSSKHHYGSSTDEEADTLSNVKQGVSRSLSGIPDLPTFFEGRSFFLYGTFDAEERRRISRLIVAFEGTIEDYMTADVSFVITNSPWDANFDKALSDHSGLAFVRPKWIYACSEKSKMVPYQPYVIVPNET